MSSYTANTPSKFNTILKWSAMPTNRTQSLLCNNKINTQKLNCRIANKSRNKFRVSSTIYMCVYVCMKTRKIKILNANKTFHRLRWRAGDKVTPLLMNPLTAGRAAGALCIPRGARRTNPHTSERLLLAHTHRLLCESMKMSRMLH